VKEILGATMRRDVAALLAMRRSQERWQLTGQILNVYIEIVIATPKAAGVKLIPERGSRGQAARKNHQLSQGDMAFG
jgi:hypothetical protein